MLGAGAGSNETLISVSVLSVFRPRPRLPVVSRDVSSGHDGPMRAQERIMSANRRLRSVLEGTCLTVTKVKVMLHYVCPTTLY